MKVYALTVVLGSLLVSSALADPVPAQVRPPPVAMHDPSIIYGSWTFPSPKAFAAAYPAAARTDEVEGAVTIDCLVGADGTLTQCDVVSESPKGCGFAEATVAVFMQHTRVDPASVDGGLKPGARKKIGYRWTL